MICADSYIGGGEEEKRKRSMASCKVYYQATKGVEMI